RSSELRDVRVQDLTIAILERPRHQELITEVAAAGARIRTLEEGDFASAVMAALPETGIDAAIGIGDLHATLIAACAVKCLGGEFLARLVARNDEERKVVGEMASHVYGMAELVPAEERRVRPPAAPRRRLRHSAGLAVSHLWSTAPERPRPAWRPHLRRAGGLGRRQVRPGLPGQAAGGGNPDLAGGELWGLCP